jgi:hypothetical protein
MEAKSVVNSQEQLLAILAMLEECRAALVANGNPETAHLVSVAALDVRMKLSGICEDDLITLCEAMMPSELVAKGLRGCRAGQAPRRRATLRLVK